MPRRLVLLMMQRLERSFLPVYDPVRMQLEAELIELRVEVDRRDRLGINVYVVGCV